MWRLDGGYGGVVFHFQAWPPFSGIQDLFLDYPSHGVCWEPYLLSCISSHLASFLFTESYAFPASLAGRKALGRSLSGED